MMNSRNKILSSIKNCQSDEILSIKTDFDYEKDIVQEFIQNATLAGANVSTVSIHQLDDELLNITKNSDDFFIYESHLGVAENGAVLCQNLHNDREKLFLSNDLIITIKRQNIVATMHQAYEDISFDNREFVTFIAGPSKTADIEQSLVLGAHGAMQLNIYLIDS